MTRLLITGATGFVGSAIARHFAAEHEVVGVARRARDHDGPFELAAADLTEGLDDRAGCTRATVIHAAAVMSAADNGGFFRGNVDATFHVLEWARRHDAPQVIYFSTGGVYPYARGHKHRETDPIDPIGYYGHTKWLGEELVRSYYRLFDLPATIVRLFFPYGPGQDRGIFPLVDHAVRDGTLLTIKPRGAPVINPVHIDDVVSAVDAMTRAPAGLRVFNLCGDVDLGFGDLVRLAEARHGKKAVVRPGGADEGDLMGDNSALKDTLGWRPERRL